MQVESWLFCKSGLLNWLLELCYVSFQVGVIGAEGLFLCVSVSVAVAAVLFVFLTVKKDVFGWGCEVGFSSSTIESRSEVTAIVS